MPYDEKYLGRIAERLRTIYADAYAKEGPLTTEVLQNIEDLIHHELSSVISSSYRVPEEFLEYADSKRSGRLKTLEERIPDLKKQVGGALDRSDMPAAIKAFRRHYNHQIAWNLGRHVDVAKNTLQLIKKHEGRIRQLGKQGKQPHALILFGTHHHFAPFLQQYLQKKHIRVEISETSENYPTDLLADLLEEKYAKPSIRHSEKQMMCAMLHEQIADRLRGKTAEKYIRKYMMKDGELPVGSPVRIYEGILTDDAYRTHMESTKREIQAMPPEIIRELLSDPKKRQEYVDRFETGPSGFMDIVKGVWNRIRKK